jgi:hypothetical protein
MLPSGAGLPVGIAFGTDLFTGGWAAAGVVGVAAGIAVGDAAATVGIAGVVDEGGAVASGSPQANTDANTNVLAMAKTRNNMASHGA